MDYAKYQALRTEILNLPDSEPERKRTTASYLLELEKTISDAKSICVNVLDKLPIKETMPYSVVADHIILAKQITQLRQSFVRLEGE